MPAPLQCVPYGPHALLIRFAGTVDDEAFQRSRALVGEIERNPPDGLAEVVPAFTSLLLEFEPHTVADLAVAREKLLPRLQSALGKKVPPAAIKEIPVRYDGEDLADVAKQHGLSPAEVIALHAAPVYKVYMLGFAPGFPYLGDLDPRLHTPRLASPRPRVHPGSVAIGGEHTGIYPAETPGGWNIIGHTDMKLFDPDRSDTEMFLLQPGDRVKFIPHADR